MLWVQLMVSGLPICSLRAHRIAAGETLPQEGGGQRRTCRRQIGRGPRLQRRPAGEGVTVHAKSM